MKRISFLTLTLSALVSYNLSGQIPFQVIFNLIPQHHVDESVCSDFNGDGKPDFVLSHNGSGTLWKSVTGTPFNNQTLDTIHSGEDIRFLNKADIDGDGDVDFIGSTPYQTGNSYVWINDGNGNFTQDSLNVDGAYFASLFADLDSDNELELVLGINHEVVIYDLENGNTVTKQVVHSDDAVDQPSAIINYPDVNGSMQLAVALGETGMYFFEQGDNGNFDKKAYELPIDRISKFSVTDLNEDGYQDLLAFAHVPDKAYKLLNQVGLSFSIEELPTVPGFRNILSSFGDVDNDGDTDILYIEGNPNFGGQRLSLLVNNDGEFEKELLSEQSGLISAGEIVDVDRDGDSDLAMYQITPFENGFLFYENLSPISNLLDQSSNSLTEVFPTVFTSFLKINASGAFSYTVFSATGRLISEGERVGTIELMTSAWPRGGYFVNIQSRQKTFTRKVVKQ